MTRLGILARLPGAMGEELAQRGDGVSPADTGQWLVAKEGADFGPLRPNQTKSNLRGNGVVSGEWTVGGGERGWGKTAPSNPVKPSQTQSNLPVELASGQWTVGGGERGWGKTARSNPVKPFRVSPESEQIKSGTPSPRLRRDNPALRAARRSRQSNPVKPGQTCQSKWPVNNGQWVVAKEGGGRLPGQTQSNPVKPEGGLSVFGE
jgi:hypothetical protein